MENELCKASHKVFRIKYHFVFCIKYRKDLFLNEDYVETLKQICKSFEQRYFMKFETIGFDEDHVHFMLQSVPKYSASKIFQVVKSITAIELFKRHKEIR
jgi:putative transposase